MQRPEFGGMTVAAHHGRLSRARLRQHKLRPPIDKSI